MNQLIDSLALVVTHWLGFLIDIWLHCVKIVQIRSFFPYFSVFSLITGKDAPEKLGIWIHLLGLIVQLKFSKHQMKKSN